MAAWLSTTRSRSARPFLRTELYERWNWRMQELALKSGLNLAKPTFVSLKLTMQCNARCLHCDIYRPEHTPPDELTAAEWATVLERLRRWLGGGAPLTVTGGEIFLRRDAFTILERASELGFAIHMLTNGWLVDAERARRIMALGPRIVQVSLDGANPDVHDFLRGLPGFGRRTEAALARLVAARAETGSPARLVVSAVIIRQNLGELAPLVRKIKALGVDEIKFQPVEQTYMEPDDPRWIERSPLWVTDPAASDRALDELIALKRGGWPIQNSIEYLDFIKFYFRDPARAYEKGRSHDQHFRSRECRTAVSDFDMSSNGDVRLCYKMEPIGNVRDEDPAVIWNRRRRCWTMPCRFLDGDAAAAASAPVVFTRAAAATNGPAPPADTMRREHPAAESWADLNRRA
jgi:MoaA/NifB/PqqE/SkfB family radical SAM enzyme